MIIIRLIGGLGNQMFQYAAASALANRLDIELVLDIRGFDNYNLREYGLSSLKIKSRIATEAELKKFPNWQRRFFEVLNKFVKVNSKFYIEPFFEYNKKWDTLQDSIHLSGYFQSEKYFLNIREKLLHEFMPLKKIDTNNQLIINKVLSCESVSLHVRRGDYVSVQKNLEIIGVCGLDYYKKAISQMREKLLNPVFFVFSNDMDWARDNLLLGQDAVFVEGNADSPEMDIFIMSQCRHHIIANSSFSWWGAWLSQNKEQRVIAPSPWFESSKLTDIDLLPASWHKVPK